MVEALDRKISCNKKKMNVSFNSLSKEFMVTQVREVLQYRESRNLNVSSEH